MIWSTDGVPLQGLTGGDVNERRVHFKLLSEAKGGEEFSFYIEVACNGLFGAGEGGNGSIFPPVENRTFPLAIAQLAVKNQLSWDLHEDLEIFLGLIKDTPPDSQLGADALYTANKIVDTFYIDRPETLKEAHEIAKKFYQDHKMLGRPGHEIIAIGNCHIDTAWLWPYDETKRKAARYFIQFNISDHGRRRFVLWKTFHRILLQPLKLNNLNGLKTFIQNYLKN
jgi:alpha-mannosidase